MTTMTIISQRNRSCRLRDVHSTLGGTPCGGRGHQAGPSRASQANPWQQSTGAEQKALGRETEGRTLIARAISYLVRRVLLPSTRRWPLGATRRPSRSAGLHRVDDRGHRPVTRAPHVPARWWLTPPATCCAGAEVLWNDSRTDNGIDKVAKARGAPSMQRRLSKGWAISLAVVAVLVLILDPPVDLS